MAISVRVQTGDFDVAIETGRLREADASIGAIAVFIGTVRDLNDGAGVSTLTLEHYPGMTEAALYQIAEQACARWRVIDVTIIHRVGMLQPTEQIVLVVVTSAHRGEAFAACEFVMDYLKTQAPFWKKEQTPTGSRWVQARASDDEAALRWADTGAAGKRMPDQ